MKQYVFDLIKGTGCIVILFQRKWGEAERRFVVRGGEGGTSFLDLSKTLQPTSSSACLLPPWQCVCVYLSFGQCRLQAKWWCFNTDGSNSSLCPSRSTLSGFQKDVLCSLVCESQWCRRQAHSLVTLINTGTLKTRQTAHLTIVVELGGGSFQCNKERRTVSTCAILYPRSMFCTVRGRMKECPLIGCISVTPVSQLAQATPPLTFIYCLSSALLSTVYTSSSLSIPLFMLFLCSGRVDYFLSSPPNWHTCSSLLFSLHL